MYILVIRNREPLSYGEESIGVKTLIKKISILLPERSEVIQVPVILGNGFRGVLRDIMTYVFLEKVVEAARTDASNNNIDVDARVLLLMLTGGVLRRRVEEQVTGRNIENLRKRVKLLPPLSIMGFALSNVMIPSKIKVSVFYPILNETFDLVRDLIENISDGVDAIDFKRLVEINVKNIIEEVQMMHKDDISKLASLSLRGVEISSIDSMDTIRGRSQTEDQEETQEEGAGARLQAIFQREYVLPGTVFIGFIGEAVPLTDVERELLALSIKRLEDSSGVGGAVARGFGSFKIEYSGLNLNVQEESELNEFIKDNLSDILDILKSNPETWLSESS